MEMRIALPPARLERRLFTVAHLEPVHRDKHGSNPSPVVVWSASHVSPSSSRPPPRVNSDSASCGQTAGQKWEVLPGCPSSRKNFCPRLTVVSGTLGQSVDGTALTNGASA